MQIAWYRDDEDPGSKKQCFHLTRMCKSKQGKPPALLNEPPCDQKPVKLSSESGRPGVQRSRELVDAISPWNSCARSVVHLRQVAICLVHCQHAVYPRVQSRECQKLTVTRTIQSHHRFWGQWRLKHDILRKVERKVPDQTISIQLLLNRVKILQHVVLGMSQTPVKITSIESIVLSCSGSLFIQQETYERLRNHNSVVLLWFTVSGC